MFVSVTIPSRDRNGCDLDQKLVDNWHARVTSRMSRNFGGVTLVPSIGAWENSANEIIQEQVTVARSFVPSGVTPEEARRWMVSLANDIREACNQEAVMVTVETGEAFFI